MSTFIPVTISQHDIKQWLITHLRTDEYMIQNLDFESYASYDPNPKSEDPVLGKWGVAKEWRIRIVASPNVCMWVELPCPSRFCNLSHFRISPSQSPDTMWRSTDGTHGTPVSERHIHFVSMVTAPLAGPWRTGDGGAMSLGATWSEFFEL